MIHPLPHRPRDQIKISHSGSISSSFTQTSSHSSSSSKSRSHNGSSSVPDAEAEGVRDTVELGDSELISVEVASAEDEGGRAIKVWVAPIAASEVAEGATLASDEADEA